MKRIIAVREAAAGQRARLSTFEQMISKGRDMEMHFAQVVKNVSTPSIEIRKLVSRQWHQVARADLTEPRSTSTSCDSDCGRTLSPGLILTSPHLARHPTRTFSSSASTPSKKTSRTTRRSSAPCRCACSPRSASPSFKASS